MVGMPLKKAHPKEGNCFLRIKAAIVKRTQPPTPPVTRLGDAPLDVMGNPLSHAERHEMIRRQREADRRRRGLFGGDFSGLLP